ncbi:MotA/TolQ/ExbB proton channel family protein [Vibrio gallicus]|uniref:MotA/TolQ/ExbB proton channel family protein n=1 Tax=Vibrio gallicus TaxID=190897 RepID=UPI0021C378B9|nr:MotA/TolQ/ExbB proton channel family protein [Vibrio gallicus]
MKHHLIKISLALLALIYAIPSHASQALLEQTIKAKATQQQHNKQRQQQFAGQLQQLQREYDALVKQRNQLNKTIDSLSSRFQTNEQTLADKQKALTLATGSLGEIFGVVRQSAKALQTEQQRSVASIGLEKDIHTIDDIIEAKTIPSKAQLHGLWQAYVHQIDNSSLAAMITVPFVPGSGQIEQKQVLRMGAFGLADNSGYLAWNSQTHLATAYRVQPKHPLTASTNIISQMPMLSVDPSRGTLLEQLSHNPTITQRIAQGGMVGQIIIALLVIGLLIGVYRAMVLLAIKSKINKQLKSIDSPTPDNPLGRVMLVHKVDQSTTIEALELRLLEAVMDEQQILDRGISTIKLLAALAPMLGLLGTVTGMIDTFQTITQFGNADPRIMAGGISMALITTVLGLIAAMPLLLMHNLLSSLCEGVRNVIEKQGVGLVAQSAERKQVLESKQVAS